MRAGVWHATKRICSKAGARQRAESGPQCYPRNATRGGHWSPSSGPTPLPRFQPCDRIAVPNVETGEATSLISGPFDGRMLQPSFDHLFAQGGCVLLYCRPARELMFRAAVGVDLISNVVIQSQNAFVVQISNSHELSPIPTIYLSSQAEDGFGAAHCSRLGLGLWVSWGISMPSATLCLTLFGRCAIAVSKLGLRDFFSQGNYFRH